MGSYQKSELSVVMKAKDLCRYVMTVTQKSPKQYRFTFTTRLQNLSMDIIEDIYLANETFVGGPEAKVKAQRRLDLQHSAMTKARLLAFISQLAVEQKALLSKQYEQISMQSTDVLNLLGAWIKIGIDFPCEKHKADGRCKARCLGNRFGYFAVAAGWLAALA